MVLIQIKLHQRQEFIRTMFNLLRTLIIFATIFFIGCASNPPNPLTAQQIENICQKKKNEAAKPTTNLSLATGSEGPKYQIGITMSSDYLAGRDPNDVYNQCKMSYN